MRHPDANFVPGEGPLPSPYLLVGESPGEKENYKKRPFVGPSGQQLDHLFLWKAARLDRDIFRIENLVRYWPGKGQEVEEEDVQRDQHFLRDAVVQCRPEIIITTGGWSTRYFLGPDADMDRMHGIPHRVRIERTRWAIVIPVYHPASTLHEPLNAPKCYEDFQKVGEVIRRHQKGQEIECWEPCKAFKEYRLTRGMVAQGRGVVAEDTEFLPDGTPYCLSTSSSYGHAYVLKAGEGGYARFESARVVVHYATADLYPLEKMGYPVADEALDDTNVMAYLLETLPRGLKALAYRLLGLNMRDFEDVVRPHSLKKMLAWLEEVNSIVWPTPEPRLKYDAKKEEWKEYNPQPVHKRVSGLLRDIAAGKKNKNGNPPDPWKRYLDLEDDQREMVEDLCGPYPPVSVADAPHDELVYYSGEDASATLGVYQKLRPMIAQDPGLEFVYQMDIATLPMCERMMRNGWLVDLDYFADLSSRLAEKLQEIGQAVADEFNDGKPVNLRSSIQTSALLTAQGLKTSKKTSTGKQSTGKKAIQALAKQAPRLVKLINDYREVGKLKTDYCDQVKKWVRNDSRIHPSIKPTTVVSGRWSCENPNLQAIPVRSKLGQDIRRGFIAKPGCLIGVWDLDQIEMRVMAHLSRDASLLRLFRQGLDIHADTASKIFGVPLKKVDPLLHRYPAKRIGFGVITGIQGPGLLDQMYLAGIYDYTLDDCERMIREWFKIYPGVKEFMNECRNSALRDGSVRCMWGRRRTLSNVYSPLEYVREEALRQSHSHIISASAQGILKRGQARLWKWLRGEVWPTGRYFEPLLQVHDEIDAEIQEDFAQEAGATVTRLLTEDPMLQSGKMKFLVPIGAKFACGPTWGDCEK